MIFITLHPTQNFEVDNFWPRKIDFKLTKECTNDNLMKVCLAELKSWKISVFLKGL